MEMAPPMTPPAPRGDHAAPAMSASLKTAMSSLFWGDRVVVLFPGWPGARGLGPYLFCLLFVLVLAALAEALHAVSTYVDRRHRGRGGRAVVHTLVLTAVHAARMGTAYLVMLAVMSFNGGVLLAAVAGHALGFLVTRSRAARAMEEEEAAGAGLGAGGAARDRDDLGGMAMGMNVVVPPSDDASKA